MKYCPACNKPYATLGLLRAHLEKAKEAGDLNHIDIIDLEGWDETSSGQPESRGNIPPKEPT